MRKDKISQDALEKAYLIFAEKGHQIVDYAHKPTDYARGTVLEPESTSQLKSNFGEYDSLGERCKEISSEIEGLQEAMKVSRTRGNFQSLQTQMKLINNLTKEKTAIEAKMATLDLARQQDDSHKRMMGLEPSYSEKITDIETKIAELESKMKG
jgi:chaperonin cofactor prefoldin